MVLTIRAIFLFLAGALCVAIFGTGVASAQSPSAQIIVVTKASGVVELPPSAVVSVSAAGPSLVGTPSSSGTLTYLTNWNNDTKVVTLTPSLYSVSVAGMSGYLYSYAPECSGTASSGETRTCTVTVYPAARPSVIVYTRVVNNDGGVMLPTQVSFTATGGNPSPAFFFGSASGVTVAVNPGSYSIQDTSASAGYATLRSSECSGTIAQGETRACTITKDDIRTSPVSPSVLTCSPTRQNVRMGMPATFTAQGGSATYTWSTAERSYMNAGPILNTTFQSSGSQIVIVTSGFATATCAVDVLARSGISPAGAVLGTSTLPYLPNTGYEPSAFGISVSILVGLFLSSILLIYARRALASIWS